MSTRAAASGFSRKIGGFFRLKAEATGVMLVLLCASIATMAAQQRTVWEGIYSAQQAERGRAEYMKACASCHAEDLRGRSTAPSLVEESFTFLWGDMPVGALLDRIQKLMPSDRPNSLSPDTYRDIVAYLLQANKFPAGDKEMDTDLDALRKVLITTKR
jgi:S-disulfanyl-L-cysteine oxidoreductase SoxD